MKRMPTMMTLKETQEKTGLSYVFLRGLVTRNEIIYIKSGRKILINYDKLVDYLNGELPERREVQYEEA